MGNLNAMVSSDHTLFVYVMGRRRPDDHNNNGERFADEHMACNKVNEVLTGLQIGQNVISSEIGC